VEIEELFRKPSGLIASLPIFCEKQKLITKGDESKSDSKNATWKCDPCFWPRPVRKFPVYWQNRSFESIAGAAGCKPESALTASYETKRYSNLRYGSGDMLWTIFAILLILWLLGFGFHVAGSLIHLLLVIAVVVLLIELITGRRAAV
jgi:hypothetical protein